MILGICNSPQVAEVLNIVIRIIDIIKIVDQLKMIKML